jgi:hypothetical protein
MLVPWKRFWVPIGQAIQCGADGKDFLNDPDSEFGQHFNPNVFPLSGLLDRQCLVLLGEPGMGKSITIEAEQESLKQAYGPTNCIWIRFRDIPDTSTFTRRVFDSVAWRNWQAGSHKLLLVIDGIDEGRQKIPDFISYLHADLETVDRSRLNLILVCRVADWPESTGDLLQSLWAEGDKARKFELCPLRQLDVRAAAEIHQVDAEAFLRAIYEKHVVGLAARPVTLFMLLRAYARDHQLPGTFRDLYREGCRILCAEVDPRRVEEIRQRYQMYSLPSEAQKLAIATRIAALLMLSGKTAVYYGPAEHAVADDLLLSDVATGTETADGAEFPVNDAWVFHALQSALFSARGENRLGFAHQTFAESLAAAYLIPTPLAQVKTLLCQRDAAQQYVIPQLAEVSAWLAGDHPAFLDFLLTNEREILLRTDVALIPADQKERLLVGLLEKARNEEIFDNPSSDRFYAGLKYPGMAGTLLATITDKGRNIVARRMAMEIGGECREAELATPLLDLIRDAADEEALKRFAARALAKLIPEDRLAELVPLADGTAAADPDDELKGAVLDALIPKRSTVGNAVPWLTRPSGSNHIGSYWSVLHYHIPRAIVPADIVPLLGLLLDRSSCFDHTSVYKEIADKTFCEATKLFDDPAVVDGFIAVWLDKARTGRPLPLDNNFKFNAIFREDASARRRIIEAALTSPRTDLEDVRRLVLSRHLVLSDQDLPWFLERLPTMDAPAKPKWVEAIRWQAHPQSVLGCWDAFWDAVRATPELEVHFGHHLNGWQLDGPIAVQARAEWMVAQEMARESQRARGRPIEERIQESITVALTGTASAWINLSSYLVHESGSYNRDYYNVDLDKAKGWQDATAERKSEVLQIARQFVIECDDPRHSPNTLSRYTFAGFRAVGLLDDAIRADEYLKGIVRTKWMQALFDVHIDGDAFQRAVSLAFDLDPASCRERLVQDFAEDGEQLQFMTLLRALEKHWSRDASEITIQLLLQRPTPGAVHNILKFLVRVDRAAAVDCFNWMRAELEISPDADLLKNLLSAGISNLTGETWPTIEPIMDAQPELARSVFQQVAHHNDDHNDSLTIVSTAEGMERLYIRLRGLFPVEEFPAHDINARSSEAQLRDQQLTKLTSLGSMEGCRSLLNLSVRYPQDSLLIRWRYKECLTFARQKAWRPCHPKQILRLVERSANRLIMDEEDLLEVVIESLRRFEVSLVGTNNPQVPGLWNYLGGGNRRTEFAPKDEEDLSGAIAAWLQNDLGPAKGVILNREVQPRRGRRADVLVDAISAEDGVSRLTIFIEVKGCWNPEIPIAIQDQLINDYLTPNGWTNGIFLVGWYICPRWDSTRKPPVNHLAAATLEDARTEVSAMAAPFDGKASPFVVEGFVLDCRLT